MKAIMYHYVREFDPDVPNFRFLDIKNFRRQLDYFATEKGFVTRAEWEQVLRTGDPSGCADKIILTFDDAMSCHYNYVFPELCARNLWGIFYVPAQPYLSGEMLGVHRVHQLCGRYDGELLYTAARDLITDDMIPFSKRQEFQTHTYSHQQNLPGVAEFKRLINYFVADTYVSEILNEIATSFGTTGRASDFYITPENIVEMHNAGMIIGAHSVTHPVMSKLDRAAQTIEIENSFGFLDTLGVTSNRTYCHPYGGFHSFNDDTIALLELADTSWSFNVESRDIARDDLVQRRQHLPRYDCNEFPHGKAS